MILLDFSKIYFDKYTNFYEKNLFLSNFNKKTQRKISKKPTLNN